MAPGPLFVEDSIDGDCQSETTMTIEFRCPACNRLLRTGADTAGKQAKCPECGGISTVPSQTAPPSPPGPGADSPFGPIPPPPPPESEPGRPFGPPGFDPENPYASPTDYAAPAAGKPVSGQWNPTQIDFGDVFSRTWEIFKREWGMCVVVVIVIVAISIGVEIGARIVFDVPGMLIGEPGIVFVLVLMRVVVTTLFSIWIGIGQALYFLKVARGEKAELSEIFSGGPYFLPVLGASILVGLITLLGYVLCIIPGVILWLMYSQYYYLILDRRVGVMDSMSISSEITSGNKLTLFLIGLVAGLVGILFVICTCCVGILAVAPFMSLLGAVVYLAITGQPTADQYYQNTPAV